MSDYLVHLVGVQLYHRKSLTLSDIDLSISPGEFVYLIGKTGSGKTTLLRSLYGDLAVNEGDITVAGFDLRKISTRKIPYLRRKLLNMVSLEGKAYKMPHELSGGEQQKVVIARALINDPLVIIADEPTGNLDPDISDEIINLLHTIKKDGVAVIMATHDYRIIEKFPSRIIKVEDNKVAEFN